MVNVAWVVLHYNRRIGARERRQLMPHVRFQVPFLGPESQLKSGFACAGLLCSTVTTLRPVIQAIKRVRIMLSEAPEEQEYTSASPVQT